MKVVYATSTRNDGSMGLSSDVNARDTVANRSRFLRKLDIRPSRLVLANQVHGARVKIVRVIRHDLVPGTDALVTSRPNIFLGIRSADCFPVFFYDVVPSVVAIAHAGWRGVVKGVAPNVVRILRTRYRLDPADINVVVGPGIRKCHFEIWPKTRHRGVAPYLKKYKQFLHKRGRRQFGDLEGAIKYQLRQCGIPAENIRVIGECTFHMPRRYFSYRRDANPLHPRGFGNMISVIGLKA